jgi:hypothetical protein
MNVENIDLKKSIITGESGLKDLVVEYIGNKLNPENDEVTVENIVEIFSEEFPEFLLVVAEENWVSGYTQALSDVQFVNQRRKEGLDDELKELHKK